MDPWSQELDRDGVDEALGDADIYQPVLAVQQAYGLLPTKAWTPHHLGGERQNMNGKSRHERRR
jgi:hypothetical protein